MIEIYDANTMWNRKGKPPVINIQSGDQGRISFSVEAVKVLGLKEGMKLVFRIHTNDPGIIYFYEDKNGMPLKLQASLQTGIRLAVYCRPLCKRMLQFFGYKVDTVKTFSITSSTVQISKMQSWFILKENIHKPIRWRKNEK